MALKENDVRWARPLWLRVAIAIGLALWLAFELLLSGDMFWATMVGLVLAYFIYSFFITFPKDVPPAAAAQAQEDEEPRS
jgi:hypothetical protein